MDQSEPCSHPKHFEAVRHLKKRGEKSHRISGLWIQAPDPKSARSTWPALSNTTETHWKTVFWHILAPYPLSNELNILSNVSNPVLAPFHHILVDRLGKGNRAGSQLLTKDQKNFGIVQGSCFLSLMSDGNMQEHQGKWEVEP